MNQFKNNGIELMDMFDSFSAEQLKVGLAMIEKEPIFEDKSMNDKLVFKIKHLIRDKQLYEQFNLIKEIPLESKEMISDIIKKLLKYNSK